MRKPKGRRKPRAKTADVRRVFPDGLVQYNNNTQSVCIPTQPLDVRDLKLALEGRRDTQVYRDGGNTHRAPADCSEKEDAADAFLDDLLSELLAKDECMPVDSIDNDNMECDAATAINIEPPVFDFKIQVDCEMEVVDDFFAFNAKVDVGHNDSALQFGRMETDNDFFVFNFENKIAPHFLVFDFGQMEVDNGLFVFNFKTEDVPISDLGQMEVDVNVPICGCSQKKFDHVAPVTVSKEEASRGIHAFEYKMDDDDDLFFDAWSSPMEEIVDDFNSDLLRLELRNVVQSLQTLEIADLDSAPVVGFEKNSVDNISAGDSSDSDVDADDDTFSDICLPIEETDYDSASDFFHHELANVIADMQALHISGFESATSWASITEPDCPSPEISHPTVDIHISEPKLEPVNNVVSIIVSTEDELPADHANTIAEEPVTPSPVSKVESKDIWNPMANMDYGFTLQNILGGFDIKLNCTRKRCERNKRNIKTRVPSTANAMPEIANGIYAARCAASARTHEGRVTTRTHAEEEDKEKFVPMRFNEDEISILANVSNRLIASNARVSPWYTKQRARKTESPTSVAPTQSILSTKRKVTPPVRSPHITSQEISSSNVNNPPFRSSSPTINANMNEDISKETPPTFPSSDKVPRPLSVSPSTKSITDKTTAEIPILSTSDTTRLASEEENVSPETTQPTANIVHFNYSILLPFHGCCIPDSDLFEYRETKRMAARRSMSPWIFSKGAALKIMPGAIANDSYHS